MDLDDTFAFSCKLCGNCCRWEADGRSVSDNLLTGADVTRMAAHLGLTPGAFARRYARAVFDPALTKKVMKLRKRPDGSCILLHEGRCAAYPARPRTCALFPLVRGYRFALDENGAAAAAEYFSPGSPAPAHKCGVDAVFTVRGWLAKNGAPVHDEEDRIWFERLWRYYTGACGAHHHEQIFNNLYVFLL